MKISFHVSTMAVFWEKGLKKRFIAEPFVADYYHLSSSDDIIIAEFTRKNKLDYIKDVAYLSLKVEKYQSHLIDAINRIHHVNYSTDFWTKAFGMGLVRFVHTLYDAYKISSLFDPTKHTINVMDQTSYQSFQDFEEFRSLFQNNNFGFEQMFSLYVGVFHPKVYEDNKIKVTYNGIKKNTPPQTRSLISRIKRLTTARIYDNIRRFVLSKRKPIVGVFHSYFSYEYMNRLLYKSLGRIGMVDYNYDYRVYRSLNSNLRTKLSNDLSIEDRFDHFFKKALTCFFPTLYVESFPEMMKHFQNESAKYNDLKYLISEAWIGNSRMSFFIAVLQQKGIQHIYNEHNYMEHYLIGNHIGYLNTMCDVYYSLGWESKTLDRVTPGASLFPFSIAAEAAKKEIDYLYIGSLPAAKMAEINCAYGEQEENAIRYFDFTEKFFGSLPRTILNKLTYRAYPNQDGHWVQYNIERRLKKWYLDFKAVDNYSVRSKEMMLKSRLNIIDYLSTAYLESLIMNIPTIVLVDPSRYYLEEVYDCFFDDLIKVGICHTNPKKAAAFINDLGDSIENWWESKEVQKGRFHFLNTNIGDPEDAIKFYLNLLKH